MPDFAVCDVSDWTVVSAEALGRDEKVWLREPGAPDGSRERDWLFKPVVVAWNGHRQGEDWAEKVVSELGRMIGVPCADVRLAVRNGIRGSISRNVAPDGWNLVVGANYLSAVVEGYVGGSEAPRGRPGHSPATIMEALADCDAPDSAMVLDAPGIFAGFLVLDALVGNQDRHDQNWAVLLQATEPGARRLAASYDHASSVGFNLRDSYRDAQLRSGGMERFASNARAHRFEHDPRAPRAAVPTLVERADEALDIAGPAVRRYWSERLTSLSDSAVAAVAGETSELSDPTRSFILELVRINRRRLLDGHG